MYIKDIFLKPKTGVFLFSLEGGGAHDQVDPLHQKAEAKLKGSEEKSLEKASEGGASDFFFFFNGLYMVKNR